MKDTSPAVAHFTNQELSFLDFCHRLLDLAGDRKEPLLERTKFVALCGESLDEFFQVQVAGLKRQVAAEIVSRSPDGLRPSEQLDAITGRVTELVVRQSEIVNGEIRPELERSGVVLADWPSLDPREAATLSELFERAIFPVLTPLAVDSGHPFPYISNLSLNLVLRVVDPRNGMGRIARVKVPPLLPRFVPVGDGSRFVPVEQVIAAHLGALFPAMTVVEQHTFRVTRNADLSVGRGDADDLLAAVELELQRRRFGQAVRLEAGADIGSDLLDMLVTEVEVPRHSVYLVDTLLDLRSLRMLANLDRPDLAAPRWSPVTPIELTGGDPAPLPSVPPGAAGRPNQGSSPPRPRGRPRDRTFFDVVASGDVLVHHPYESFVTSVEAFIVLAAVDPDVVAIKQTLYRTTGDSAIVEALIGASRAGKQVTVVVELHARFDEQTNVTWARRLEEAGVHVAYGLVGLKTHSKMALVVRREGDGVRRYCHVGTGNYNEVTARTYEDVGLFTADPDLGSDIGNLFNFLTGASPVLTLRRIVVAPHGLRAHLVGKIREEAAHGTRGRVIIKVNGLTDPEIIDALYDASTAGTTVELLVRSRCSIRAGIPGLSEHVRVRSVVGRYLEHSRLYGFGGVHGRPFDVSVGSADLTARNLDRRIEVMVPVMQPSAVERLRTILETAWADETNSWELTADGRWIRVGGRPGGVSLQRRLREQALQRAGVSPDPTSPMVEGTPPRPTAPRSDPGAAPVVRRSRWWLFVPWRGRRRDR